METEPQENIGVAVVILAGGIGSRMKAGQNKVYLQIRDRHLLSYSLETADSSSKVDEIVVVIRADDRELAESLVATYATRVPVRITTGGASRHESEYRGIASLREEIEAGSIGVVAVHDGARPFMSRGLLERVIGAAAVSGGAIAGLPIADQLYENEGLTFVDSSEFVWVQTPQAFDAATLLESHDAAAAASFEGVDTAEVVEQFSDQPIAVVDGEGSNIKVTYMRDLAKANALASDRRETTHDD